MSQKFLVLSCANLQLKAESGMGALLDSYWVQASGLSNCCSYMHSSEPSLLNGIRSDSLNQWGPTFLTGMAQISPQTSPSATLIPFPCLISCSALFPALFAAVLLVSSLICQVPLVALMLQGGHLSLKQ